VADLRVRAARIADAYLLAPRLRAADQAEAQAMGLHALDALADGIISSDWSCTVDLGRRPIAVFGLRKLAEGVGAPWMAGADEIAQQKRAVARLAPRYIAVMLQSYPRLLNYVHAENEVAVRWLQRTGFQLRLPAPRWHGVFHLFEMNR
jgi:hypothetical protein